MTDTTTRRLFSVWFWQGGTEAGRWQRTVGDLADLHRGGHVARILDAGAAAPEGPPSAETIRWVLSGEALRAAGAIRQGFSLEMCQAHGLVS